MGLRTLIICSLLFVFVRLLASVNPKFGEWLTLKVMKVRTRMMVKRCDGFCGQSGYHTHDLRLLGKWHFIWRYTVLNAVFRDPRPQPPIDDKVGAPWIDEYNEAWKKQFPGYTPASCYVRDEKGFWVWVTNTPQFDRNWFDEKGWQFPAAWITGPSQDFYKIGQDYLSTVVALPNPDGTTTVPKDEVFS
jgi:hypothetical protein